MIDEVQKRIPKNARIQKRERHTLFSMTGSIIRDKIADFITICCIFDENLRIYDITDPQIIQLRFDHSVSNSEKFRLVLYTLERDRY
jgi:hypothetical protein